MAQTNKVACVFGGTGFLGTQVVRELAKAGYTVKVATRVPERAYALKPSGSVGQIVPFACDYSDQGSVDAAIRGCDAVVNLIGILYETGRDSFRKAHVGIPAMIAGACARAGVRRFIHVSALGIEGSSSRYAQSKMEGEGAVRAALPDAVILRPSVIFGMGDDFFNMFATMARFLPVLPLIGGGKTLFQPVYVGDVADAVMAVLRRPDFGDMSPAGKVYELGGPDVVSFKDIYTILFTHTGRRRALMPLPFGLAKVQGAVFSGVSCLIGWTTGLRPKPPLTADQVESLKADSVVAEGAEGFADLGIVPTAMAAVLPGYLNRFKPGGRFGDKKSA
jgi:NADH dehydrogenase